MLLSLAGCASEVQLKPNPQSVMGEQVHAADPLPYYDGRYQLAPGDEIEVIYHINKQLQGEYFIAIGDQIRVEFFSYPQFDRTLNVRPDGMITLPYMGDLMAVGKTPMQLTADIDELYSELMTRPRSSVSLIRYGERIRELKESIKTSQRGQSRLALVQPDGRVTLPLLPPVMAAGQSIGQVSDAINHEYAKLVPGMSTSTTLTAANGNKVYVFGAVARPGYYKLEGPTTMLQAVAMAGGFAGSHERSSSLLITRDEFNRPVGQIVDLDAVIGEGNIGRDMFLRQSDVVYIPTTWLGRAALTGESIRRMIPVNLGFSYDLSESVNFITN